MFVKKELISFLTVFLVVDVSRARFFCFDVCQMINIHDLCAGKTCVPKSQCSWEWKCVCNNKSTSTDCFNGTATSTQRHNAETSTPVSCQCVNGHCVENGVIGTTCSCKNGWGGKHCDVDLSNRTMHNVCVDTFKQRQLSERECYGYTCVYGVCKMTGSEVTCDCDPGATGQICQNKCCKKCVSGKCFYIKEEQREICVCDPDHHGPLCEKLNI